MARRSDPAKLREWSDRFRRFRKSSQTIADFCRAEAVSEALFYYWRRRLPGSGDRRRRQSVKRRSRSGPAAVPLTGFRSVVVTPTASAASVKVRLPGGAEIEMRDNLAVIEQVVKQLLDHQTGAGGKGC